MSYKPSVKNLNVPDPHDPVHIKVMQPEVVLM